MKFINQPINSSIEKTFINATVEGGSPAVVQRYFATLDSAFNQYISIPLFTAVGDFSIPFSFVCPAQAIFVIAGLSSNFAHHINVSSTKIEVRIAGARLSFTGSFQDNKQHTGSVDRAGSVVTVTVGGVTIPEDTLAGSSASFMLDSIGQEAGADYSDGIVSNIGFNSSSDNRLYALDEDLVATSTVVDSVGGQNGTAINITGSDLYTFDGSVSPNAWTMVDSPFTVIEVAGT